MIAGLAKIGDDSISDRERDKKQTNVSYVLNHDTPH
jgi:hypothetical protein